MPAQVPKVWHGYDAIPAFEGGFEIVAEFGFVARGIEVARLFYFGESVLLPEYRGQGVGHAFFDHREAQARGVGATAANLVKGAATAADIGLDLHSRNIASILASWEAGEEAETSGAEGRKSVSIINALYESARNDGAPIDVK